MYRILLGFRDTKFQKTLSQALYNYGDEAEFIVSTRKSGILHDIQTEKPDVVILGERCEDGEFSIDEYAQIKDGYPGQLIPLLPDALRGSARLKTLCVYGINDGVFLDKKGNFKSSEILIRIHQKKTSREARSIYGIQNIKDMEGYAMDKIDDDTLESILVKLEDESSWGKEGSVFKQILYDLDLNFSAIADLIERLPDMTLEKLRRTKEYYEIVKLLKKHRLINKRNERYKIPKSYIKQIKKGGSVAENEVEKVSEKQSTFDPSEYDLDDFDDSGADNGNGMFSIQGYVGGSNSSTDKPNNTYGMNPPHALSEDDLDEEGEGIASESLFGASANSVVRKAAETSKKDTPEQLNTTDKESTDVPEKKRNGAPIIIGVVCGLCFLFLILMICLGFSIRSRIKTEAALTTTVDGYDTQYHTDEERIELTSNGSAVLVDTTEEDLPVDVVEENPILENGDSDVMEDIVDEETPQSSDSIPDDIEYTGKTYRGLDLVNYLNTEVADNVTIYLSSGARIDIAGTLASLEDINATASFKEGIVGGVYWYIQE